ncbi:MAG: hypothetical protein M3229_02985, partial [Actinomycetota bacterium]|nr:hypothetical protein [Actinomycetota bacterium]
MVEVVFMMLILKLPIVYLVGVCWWAIRAEPRPLEPAALPLPVEPGPRRPISRPPLRSRRGGPDRRPS